MKVTGKNIESVLRGVDAKIGAVLVYGPDSGLVHERADRLTAAVAGDTTDPFRVSEVSPDRVQDDPAMLVDEGLALTFGGGRRVVRLRGAREGETEAVGRYLSAGRGGGLLIVEAGDLGKRSALRQLFESSGEALALACYHDDGEAVGHLVDEELGRAGVRLTDEARGYLVDFLGGDRGVTRREIEKLIAYMGTSDRSIEINDVIACIGDSAALSLDDLAFAVGDGNLPMVERLIARSLQEGATPVALLRAVGRHFLRLHFVAGAASAREHAMRSLRPPVFFKFEARFHAQIAAWTAGRLLRALDLATQAEIDCKQTGAPALALSHRKLFEIAALAPRRARAQVR
jgi:DNA polymerase-3 subunit delta